MELIKKFVTNNIHYKNNKIIPVKRLILHSVGVNQPNPDVFVRNWDDTSNRYLTQIVVGIDKAYEVLPCTSTRGKAVFCYHVGNANSYSIGVELTEPKYIKYTSGSKFIDNNPTDSKNHVMKTYKNAVEIFAKLCIFHRLDPKADGVILSHKECHDRGIGTNHGDVEHLWGKYGLTMDQFREDVNIAVNKYNTEETTPITITIKEGDVVKIASSATYYSGKKIPKWVKEQNWIVRKIIGDKIIIDENVDGTNTINSPIHVKFLTVVNIRPVEPYHVKVSIKNLNMRTGPSTSYPSIGYIKPGVYTIIELHDNKWGKLKSQQKYNGKMVDTWIYTGHTTKVNLK